MASKSKNEISFDDFEKIEFRVGTIIEAKEFAEAKKAAYKLLIDFGELGKKKSSAQITDLYTVEELKGRQIIAVTNFPSKQIASLKSECLVLGATESGSEVILLKTDKKVPNGTVIR
ncbi:MAG: tRNA-binding protein [Bacteroidia bacterium]|nr:tRNA-binding protein [Bacteroidia bacterium]